MILSTKKEMKTKNMTTLKLRTSIGRSLLRLGLPRIQTIWIIRGFLFIPLALVCFGLAPASRAVLPRPDGGYNADNTAEGTRALFSLTTGLFNTALGFEALYSNRNGSANTATGAFALTANIDSANNVATGFEALASNTSGNNNTANGSDALINNTTGSENTATGFEALYSNNDANDNTALGAQALYNNIEGDENTAVGVQALFNNAFNPPLYYGHDNTAVGFQALYNNIEGAYNIALGAHAGDALTFFSYWNIDIGNEAVGGDSGGESNTIRIGTPAQPGGWFEPGNGGPSGQSRAFIAGIRDITPAKDDAIPLLIAPDATLGTASPSPH